MECIKRLSVAAQHSGVDYRLYVFDDGSTDGTTEAVRELEPTAVLLSGDGNYFWNRSMNRAFGAALQAGFDGYLWLNDDTYLEKNAFEEILKAREAANETEVMVVGAVRDPISNQMTYGGKRLVSPLRRPFLALPVIPAGVPEQVDVVNGNVFYIPHSVAKALGNLDPLFEHAMGDTDYSMRARKRGYKIFQTGNYVGYCSNNPVAGTHKDRQLGLVERLRKVLSRKGLPWKSWFVMCWRYGGPFWPIHFLWAYLKVIIASA